MTTNSVDFEAHLKTALKHLHHPEKLEELSPLSSVYFLGAALGDATHFPPGARGRLLSQALQEASQRLWGEAPPRSRAELEAAMPDVLRQPGSPRYSYLVLELRYMRRFFRPRRLPDIWEEFLGESRAEFYRDLDVAVHQLGQALLERLRPTLRPEEPLPPPPLFGRATALAVCQQRLQAGQTVSLAGAGGMGKSSLGQALAQEWQSGPVFWLTIRPMLNDNLSSVLFALAYFLHQQGASHLWRKLLADAGRLDNPALALSLLRYDLAELRQAPLLCFDEVDRLRPAERDTAQPEHRQLLEFLDSLRGLTPLLLIGQRAILESHYHLALEGLHTADLADWFAQVGVQAGPNELEALHQYTHGNPRLTQLCLLLLQAGDSLGAALKGLSSDVALQALFDRLWTRTDADEHRWLEFLAVFRSPAPLDSVPLARPALESLLARGLIVVDGTGGYALWPALREMVGAELSAESREQAHLRAAWLRSAHAEYTAAAYHYWQAGRPAEAIQVWFPQRQQAIARGQAGAALTIFQNISLNQVGSAEREALALLRAELKQLQGDLAGGAADLAAVPWTTPSEISSRARLLQGYFQNARGYPDAALSTYADGMALVARLLNQLAQYRGRRSRVYIRQRQLEDAWREARLAQYEVENLQAIIQAERGDLNEAEAAHKRALATAVELGHEAGVAQTHYDLAALSAQQGRLQEMLEHTAEAMRYYERIGDDFNLEMARINLAAGYIQTQQFSQAALAAQIALRFFERARDPYGLAGAAANLAEAYCELGDLAQAEHFAFYVIQQEERHMLPYAYFTLGRVRQAQGRIEQAVAALLTCAQVAEANADRYLLAYAQRALGAAYRAQGQEETAAAAYARASGLFEELGLADEVRVTRQQLAAS